jgi:hypothetical protein
MVQASLGKKRDSITKITEQKGEEAWLITKITEQKGEEAWLKWYSTYLTNEKP